MAFTGEEGEKISLDTASAWTANFREQNPDAVQGHFFGELKISSVLDQEGAVGIRIYNAIDDNGVAQLILVGVDANEDDLENGILIDFSTHCPPKCGKANRLNGL